MLRSITDSDHQTGEVLSRKQKYIPDVLNEEGYKVPIHKLGAKLFSEVSFPAGMTDAEIGKMARLAKLMIADSNMLGYRTRAGIKAYTETQIIEIVTLSRKRGREFLQKMLKMKVMQVSTRKYGEVQQEEYYINPAYFFAGKRISINLYLLFRESLDGVLPKWIIKEFMKAAGEQVKPQPRVIDGGGG